LFFWVKLTHSYLNLFRHEGINIANTKVEYFENSLKSALRNNSIYNTIKLKNLGYIPSSQVKSGDFILWIKGNNNDHMGIISTLNNIVNKSNPEKILFQCNGTGFPKTEADETNNLGAKRGVHPINFITATTGSGYWGTGYIILRLEDLNPTIADIDGNLYHTITIGTQIWMVENLKVTHYRNGDAIPNIIGGTQWGKRTTGGYCNYENNINNVSTYGHLYNWYAVHDARNIAPIGWHVPSDEEWSKLTNYLGGATVAGNNMKETGTTHWISPNAKATNSSGFTALPGGYRVNDNGLFSYIGFYGVLWSSSVSQFSTANGSCRYLTANSATITWTSGEKSNGFSVRCVKD
jgi:uncharacterized protein (TIGR02145 family)